MRTIARVGCVLALLVSIGPVRASDEIEPRELVIKAIEAHGGADAIKKLKAIIVRSKGKYYTFGVPVEFLGETAIQMPDRNLQKVEFASNGQKSTFVRILDGDKGWQSFNGLTADLSKAMIVEAQEQQYAQSVERLLPLVEKGYKLTSLGETTFGGRPVLGMRVERDGHRPIELFFDRDSYLLLKSETVSKDSMSSGKEFKTTKIYDNYKKVDGLMAAWKVTILQDGKELVDSDVTEIKFSEKLDERVFTKP